MPKASKFSDGPPMAIDLRGREHERCVFFFKLMKCKVSISLYSACTWSVSTVKLACSQCIDVCDRLRLDAPCTA